MTQWTKRLIILGCVMIAALVRADSVKGYFSSDLEATDYDCIVTLEPSKSLSHRAALRLLVEWGQGNSYTEISLNRSNIEITALIRGKKKAVARLTSGVQPGKPYRLTVMRRGESIGIMRNETLLGRADVPRPAGTEAGVTADTGWKIVSSRIQRIEPVVFSDDFMRDTHENSPWTIHGGTWSLKSAWDNIPHGNARNYQSPDMAQNPFAWNGKSQGNQPAVCLTGNAFWEDYTSSVAVNASANAAAGMFVNMTDARNGYLIRWSSANDHTPGGNELTLYKITNGVKNKIAHNPGGYVPGQWYRLTVISSLGTLRVLVDRRERLVINNLSPWRGGIGLYAEGNSGVTFDDVTVYGRTLNTDLLYETVQTRVGQRFVADTKGMQDWSIRKDDWITDSLMRTFRWYRLNLYGNHNWISMTVVPAPNPVGELWMTLNGDGVNTSSGYRAVLQQSGVPTKVICTLYRETTELAHKALSPLTAGTEYSLRFWHVGNRIWLELDGETILEATDPQPLKGIRAAYRRDTKAFAKVSDLEILGHNTLDYPFADAPTDWLTAGNWEPTIRWSCTPNWSFLAGWSRGEAALWQKQRFSGDHSIEAFVSTKMDYYRETDIYYNRQGYFAVTLCGDGKDPRSGYVGVYGYPGEDGTPVARAVLLRNGVVVASMPIAKRSWSANHHVWFHLQLTKQGNTVSFTAKVAREVYPLTFTDEQPLDEGIPAVWTYDNAMCVARVRLDYANSPTPRTDPQVVIAQPWYPEWANQHSPLALDLSNSWSTTGQPLNWKITSQSVPTGDEAAVTVTDGKLTFIPTQSGRHWYRIAAHDQAAQSQDYHLSLSVFNPAIKRDDAHALVLYRFDEGSGTIVHDRSEKGPALDLRITPDPANFEWLPGQGVRVRGGVKPLTSSVAADKLLALQDTKAYTFECWESAETLYGPFGRSGCLFTWESLLPSGVTSPDGKTPLLMPNLALAYIVDQIAVATGGSIMQANPKLNSCAGFLTSLHHIVVTSNGTITTWYFDGVKLGELNTPWNAEQWVAGAPLFVGNQQDGRRPHTGSLYLLAIHDRAFTSNDVQRHFQAGPSAR